MPLFLVYSLSLSYPYKFIFSYLILLFLNQTLWRIKTRMAKQADLTKTLINNQHVTDMSLQYYFVCELWEAELSYVWHVFMFMLHKMADAV